MPAASANARLRSRSQRAMLGAMIDAFDPDPQAIVYLLQGEHVLGVEVGEELLSYGAEESFHFAATFRLIGTRVHNASLDEMASAVIN
jgi:hypothetical protein